MKFYKIQTAFALLDSFSPNVGSSKNLGRATFRKMPEACLKIAQKGLKNTFFGQNFAEAPSLGRVWVGYFGLGGGGLTPPQTPPRPCMILTLCSYLQVN